MPTEPGDGTRLNRFSETIDPYANQDDGSGGSQVGDDGQPSNPGAQPSPTTGGPTGSPSGAPSGPGSMQPTVRAIEEFIRTQGTFCVNDGSGGCQLYAAPTSNYLAWYDQQAGATIAVDYAGILNTWLMQNAGRSLGTQFNGSVVEEPLGDGTARVRINLDVVNAASFAVRGPELGGDLIFGNNVNGLSDGKTQAALGNVHMLVELINPVGAPIPDLVQLIRFPRPDQRLVNLLLDYSGEGPMGFAYKGTGEPGSGRMTLHYDGSQGGMMWSNPQAGGTTPPTGYATMQIDS